MEISANRETAVSSRSAFQRLTILRISGGQTPLPLLIPLHPAAASLSPSFTSLVLSPSLTACCLTSPDLAAASHDHLRRTLLPSPFSHLSSTHSSLFHPSRTATVPASSPSPGQPIKWAPTTSDDHHHFRVDPASLSSPISSFTVWFRYKHTVWMLTSAFFVFIR
ncbi:hypothetical protein CKAN_00115900 [Cinnamomum micranthum f. kanehirae]|uniref:Uncharacterized protein n=1 Tax=Cinnamomum micranthum f. kanehirae TaxID=337451 RepID=A0A3S3NPX9_9MAGN|nr:hypothetical protein CKAN_00115900 [Cinnamomum micranthum f. kanehirae]